MFPDNFVTVLKHSDDPKPYSKLTADLINLKTTATVSQRPSLEPRNEADNKPNPPILKKPELLKKVSPSAVKGFRGLIGSRKNDAVDGIASSKSPTGRNDVKIDGKKEKNGESGFDQVERTPLLKDVRAGRAKPPSKRFYRILSRLLGTGNFIYFYRIEMLIEGATIRLVISLESYLNRTN